MIRRLIMESERHISNFLDEDVEVIIARSNGFKT